VTRHYLGLRDAAVLATRDLLLTGRAITDLIESEAMGAVVGAAGLGKTFAIEHALAGREEQVIRLTFEARPTMRLVADRLLVALTGAPGRGTRFAMTDQLLNRLSDRRRLVVIGEAQNLNRDCFEYLRHLHDDPFTRFALLFDGGDGCWEVLAREPMLRSRIYRRVAFRALSDADVLALIPDYHPIYAGVDPELLVLINEKAANGRLRSWAAFTVVVRRRTVADRAPHHRDRGPVRPAARRAHDRRAENTHLQATGCRRASGLALFVLAAGRPDSVVGWLLVCRELGLLAREIGRVHRARGELQRAHEIETDLHGELEKIRARIDADRPDPGSVVLDAETEAARRAREPLGPVTREAPERPADVDVDAVKRLIDPTRQRRPRQR
jgi:hypothetical protein